MDNVLYHIHTILSKCILLDNHYHMFLFVFYTPTPQLYPWKHGHSYKSPKPTDRHPQRIKKINHQSQCPRVIGFLRGGGDSPSLP